MDVYWIEFLRVAVRAYGVWLAGIHDDVSCCFSFFEPQMDYINCRPVNIDSNCYGFMSPPFFGSVLFCILILSCKHAVTNNAMCTHVGHHFIWIRTKHDWWVSLSLLNCADSVWMNCSGLWIIYIALLKPPMIIYGFVWNLGTQKPLKPHGLSACSPLKQQFGFVCF